LQSFFPSRAFFGWYSSSNFCPGHQTLVIFIDSHAELVELLQTCRLPRLVLHLMTCVQGCRQSMLIHVSIVLIHLATIMYQGPAWNKQWTTN
jgi:hypothetical protein